MNKQEFIEYHQFNTGDIGVEKVIEVSDLEEWLKDKAVVPKNTLKGYYESIAIRTDINRDKVHEAFSDGYASTNPTFSEMDIKGIYSLKDAISKAEETVIKAEKLLDKAMLQAGSK